MVRQTRQKNKNSHPAAPVMSEAAKVKAGITPAKPRAKRMTKDAMIQELEARIAQLESPDDAHPSKEPLFTRGSSGGDEVETDPDSGDDSAAVGGKRSRKSQNHRELKRTKTYASFGDVRPTIRNKPSGLANTWYDVATTSSPHRTSPHIHDYTPSPLAFYTPSPPFPSLPSASQPQLFSTQSVESFFPQAPHSPMDVSAVAAMPSMPDSPLSASFTESDRSFWLPPTGPSSQRWESGIISLPRRYTNENGVECAVGIRDLPPAIHDDFRNNFIRRIMKLVFSSQAPWVNPSIEILQHEFNLAFPTYRAKLHLDDAAVIPTIRDLGILRFQIGSEAIKAVINHLPSQFNKRMLESKPARAAYVQALISDKQHPFIWEYFRPGNIPVGGSKLYYDDKRRGRFQSAPVLKAFSVYFTAHGVRTPIPQLDPGAGFRPIGALALAATAVERAYQMHRTGDFIQLPNEFSTTNWDPSTRTFLDIIENDLTNDDWTGIFRSLYKLSKSQSRAARLEVGAPAEEPAREALLPVDPPTPPPLD